MPDAGSSRALRPWPHRFAILLCCATALLLYSGGMVTSFNAGLAVPDWPLTFGALFPEGWMRMLNVFIEHRHRLVGAGVGCLVIALAIWTQLADPRAWMRRFAWALLGAICLQGLLGGLRVTELSITLAVIHACTAQLVFALTVLCALFTSPSWTTGSSSSRPQAAGPFHLHASLASVLVFIQLVTGAVLRHTQVGLLLHVCGAIAVVVVVGWLVIRLWNEWPTAPALTRPACALGALLITQVALGLGSWMMTLRMDDRLVPTTSQWLIPTAHVVTGALILACCVALTAIGIAASRSGVAMPASTLKEACATL